MTLFIIHHGLQVADGKSFCQPTGGRKTGKFLQCLWRLFYCIGCSLSARNSDKTTLLRRWLNSNLKRRKQPRNVRTPGWRLSRNSYKNLQFLRPPLPSVHRQVPRQNYHENRKPPKLKIRVHNNQLRVRQSALPHNQLQTLQSHENLNLLKDLVSDCQNLNLHL